MPNSDNNKVKGTIQQQNIDNSSETISMGKLGMFRDRVMLQTTHQVNHRRALRKKQAKMNSECESMREA